MKDHSGLIATRRDFLSSAAALTVATMLPQGLVAQVAAGSDSDAVPQARLAGDPMRPQFHLLPARDWMNDPNGPIYFNGKYHMFFQYNPQAAVWGDMSWYHSISPDMIHWTSLPLAFTPTPGSADSFGCFSGSALQVGKRVYQVYTGTQKSGEDLATIRDGQNNVRETQCLAYSDDPRLIQWTKLPEPIIPMPPKGMKITGFRDPSAWKQGDWYYMTVGAGEAEVGGCVLLYRSRDLKSWDYLHKLTSGIWNSKKTANPCDDGEMWECPDFFALDGQHVLIYSTLGKVFWQSGFLDEAAMTFKALKTGLLDLDAFYAPKTQLDAEGRRILWGWIPERRPEQAMREAGWSGMMSLPRLLNLDPDGTLRVQTLPQVSRLRASSLPCEINSNGASTVLPRASGEALCTGSSDHEMKFTMSNGPTELMSVNYSPEKHVFLVDGKEIVLQKNDVPKLHAFVDGSVIELILGERVGYTKRFYFTGSAAPDVSIRTTGPGKITMNAWKITSISNNRLTTPAHAV